MDTYLGKLTLYDFLGYLLPGLIAVLSVMWLVLPLSGAIFVLPTSPWSIVLLLLGSYVAGHLLQSLLAIPLSRDRALRRIEAGLADHDRQLCDPLIAKAGVSRITVSQFLDRLRVEIPEREWLVARQGFYRGMAGAGMVVVLCYLVVIVLSLLRGSCSLESALINCIAIVGACVCTIVMARRYQMFVEYEVWFVLAALRRRLLGL